MAKRLRKQDKVGILASLPLFEHSTKRDLAQMASMMVEMERPAGAYLTRQGQSGGIMFVIVEGEAEVLADDPESHAPVPRVIGRLGPGDPFGELSLIDGRARSATVRALTDVHLLEVVADDFRELVNRSPSFVLGLLKALSSRVREMDLLTS